MRITASFPFSSDDASVVRLADGTYLMAYSRFQNSTGPRSYIHDYYLAASPDGLSFTPRSSSFAQCGTSSLVMASDGTLFFYCGG